MKYTYTAFFSVTLISALLITSAYAKKLAEAKTKASQEIEEIFSIEPAPLKQKPVQKPAVQKNQKPSLKQKIRKITNAITKEDLGYYKMFSTHYPQEFIVKVNGKPVESGKSIEVRENKLTIQYEYEWKVPFGKRTGAKEVTFEIPENTDEAQITFAGWNEAQRIEIPQAKKLSDEIHLSK